MRAGQNARGEANGNGNGNGNDVGNGNGNGNGVGNGNGNGNGVGNGSGTGVGREPGRCVRRVRSGAEWERRACSPIGETWLRERVRLGVAYRKVTSAQKAKRAGAATLTWWSDVASNPLWFRAPRANPRSPMRASMRSGLHATKAARLLGLEKERVIGRRLGEFGANLVRICWTGFPNTLRTRVSLVQ